MEGDQADKVVPFGDGFHTASPGGLLMAHAILTGLGAPAIVSDASIDATAKTATGEKCNIENLTVEAETVSFDRTDEALPLPVQPDWVSILPYVNDLKDLNLYALTVLGLKDGDYDIAIDGVKVMKASAKELAAGINLGNATTGPIFEQSNKVHAAIDAKNKLVFDRFFNVVKFNVPGWVEESLPGIKAKELTKRMEKIDKAQADIYKLAEPKSHMFTVTPLAK